MLITRKTIVFVILTIQAEAVQSFGSCGVGWRDIGYGTCLKTYGNNRKGSETLEKCRHQCEAGGGEFYGEMNQIMIKCLCKMTKVKNELDKQMWDQFVDKPFNKLFPGLEAKLSYPSGARTNGYPGVIPTSGVVLAEQMLSRPTATWDTRGHDGLWTVIMPDVSLRNNDSNMQWLVTNIPGTNIKKGEEVMEYIPPIAWRNCWNGMDNHGRPCERQRNGMIYDPNYTHQTVFWVFKQREPIVVDQGMKQSGCQVNAGSSFTPKGSPVWTYSDILRFMSVYNLTLHAGTFFKEPYTPMVGSILCQYHFCIGDLPFLAGAPGLPGITDRPECGPNGPPDLAGNAGITESIDWAELNCRNCQQSKSSYEG